MSLLESWLEPEPREETMAKKNTSGSAAASGNTTKTKRPKRDWSKDSFTYIVAINVPANGDAWSAIQQAVTEAGGTVTIRNRVFKRGKQSDESGELDLTPTNDEIDAIQP